MLEAACAEAYIWMMAKYDALNPAALKRLLADGVNLPPFSERDPGRVPTRPPKSVYEEFAAKNPKFKQDLRAVEEIPRRADPVVLDRGRPRSTTS